MAFDADTAGTPLVALDHEELVIRRGRRTGAYTIVAVHSTALGPARRRLPDVALRRLGRGGARRAAPVARDDVQERRRGPGAWAAARA